VQRELGRVGSTVGAGGAGVDAPESMRRVLLCMPEAVEGELHLREVLEVPEVIRCVLLCILEVVEGKLCLPEASEVLEALEVRVIRCVLLCMLEAVGGGLFAGGVVSVEGAGGDALCARYSVFCLRLRSVGSVSGFGNANPRHQGTAR